MFRKTMKLYIETDPIETIKEILDKHLQWLNVKYFLFGSRARKKHNEFSDRDIWIKWEKKTSIKIINKIKNDFDETPYRIDITDFKSVNKEFQKTALKHIIYF